MSDFTLTIGDITRLGAQGAFHTLLLPIETKSARRIGRGAHTSIFRSSMIMTIAGSACVEIANAKEAIELVFDLLAKFCASRSRDQIDYLFNFDFAQARVRPQDGALWLHVESTDIQTCHGAKILLEAAIAEVAVGMPERVMWIEARDTPFEAMIEHKAAKDTEHAVDGRRRTPDDSK